MEDYTMPFNLSILKRIPFKRRTKSRATDPFTPKGYTSIVYTRDTATAALACAEAISHPGLDQTLIDSLLVTGLAQNLDKQSETSDLKTSQETAQQLLPNAKESLHGFYEQSKTENPDFKDIIHAANEECDIEFLQLVTGLFTKEFVKQTYGSNTQSE
jgi:hypothetical protein